jgi:phosphosulfolactate phosphohydrolase-like enzyme
MAVRIVKGIDGARGASGVVVVIETAAYAFRAGLTEIELVSTVEEAFAASGFRMGEVGGRLIPGFDHNNSPSRLLGRPLTGRGILRTGSGTQCVVAATGASEVWLGSLVVASATARALQHRLEVTLVASGSPDEGEEDLACAELMASLIRGTACSKESVVAAVRNSRAAAKHHADDPDFPIDDVGCAVAIDVFDFGMKVDRHAGRAIARPFVQERG